jgi:hypothetical protein
VSGGTLPAPLSVMSTPRFHLDRIGEQSKVEGAVTAALDQPSARSTATVSINDPVRIAVALLW